VKGDPKNYIDEGGIEKIADTFLNRKEEEKFSKIVKKEDIIKNDYNISPSRYIQTTDAEVYRPIAEIIDELKELETEAKEIDEELKSILNKIGY